MARAHFKIHQDNFWERHPHITQLLGDLLYVFLVIAVSMVLAVLAYEGYESTVSNNPQEVISSTAPSDTE